MANSAQNFDEIETDAAALNQFNAVADTPEFVTQPDDWEIRKCIESKISDLRSS